MEWFPLTLLCAFSLATADALTKRHLADCRTRELVLVRMVAPALLLAPLMLLHPLPPVPAPFWWWLALLVPLEVAAMFLYMRAIRDTPPHLTLPYLAFTPVFNVLTGWWILGETVSGRGLAGVLLVVAGAYLLNLKHLRSSRGLWQPLAAVARERGSRLMLGVAAIYSITSVGGKAAMAYATPATFGPFYFVVIGGLTALFFALREPSALTILRRRPAPVLAIGLAMAAMVLTHFAAIARVEVAYMITVKRTSLLFGIAYGALWFGERGTLLHLFAGLLMVGGVGLILI